MDAITLLGYLTKDLQKTPEPKVKYGYLGAILPPRLGNQITDWVRKNIPNSVLGAGGRETTPHVTIKYGFLESGPETLKAVQDFLTTVRPFSIKLLGLSLFKNNPDGDVLKIDVESQELKRLNREFSSRFRCHDKHPHYHPHLTLAYVDPRYSGSLVRRVPYFLPAEVMIDTLEFSTPERKRTRIHLSRGIKAMSYLNNLSGGALVGARIPERQEKKRSKLLWERKALKNPQAGSRMHEEKQMSEEDVKASLIADVLASVLTPNPSGQKFLTGYLVKGYEEKRDSRGRRYCYDPDKKPSRIPCRVKDEAEKTGGGNQQTPQQQAPAQGPQGPAQDPTTQGQEAAQEAQQGAQEGPQDAPQGEQKKKRDYARRGSNKVTLDDARAKIAEVKAKIAELQGEPVPEELVEGLIQTLWDMTVVNLKALRKEVGARTAPRKPDLILKIKNVVAAPPKETPAQETPEVPAEEPVAEETPAEETPAEETPAEPEPGSFEDESDFTDEGDEAAQEEPGPKINLKEGEDEEQVHKRAQRLTGIDDPKKAMQAIAKSTGGPADATYTVESMFDVDSPGEMLFVYVDHPSIKHCQRSFGVDADGQPYINNQGLYLTFQGTGQGTDFFSRQVDDAAAAGFKYLETSAAGDLNDPRQNGYYTWPRLGYDAPIKELYIPNQRELQEKFPDAKTLLDVMATPEGRAWWKENGSQVSLKFDLAPGSRSRQVLDAYLAERNKLKGETDGGRDRSERDGGEGSGSGVGETPEAAQAEAIQPEVPAEIPASGEPAPETPAEAIPEEIASEQAQTPEQPQEQTQEETQEQETPTAPREPRKLDRREAAGLLTKYGVGKTGEPTPLRKEAPDVAILVDDVATAVMDGERPRGKHVQDLMNAVEEAAYDPDGWGKLGNRETYEDLRDLVLTASKNRYEPTDPVEKSGEVTPTGESKPKGPTADRFAAKATDIKPVDAARADEIVKKYGMRQGSKLRSRDATMATAVEGLAQSVKQGGQANARLMEKVTEQLDAAARDETGYGVFGDQEAYEAIRDLVVQASGGAYKPVAPVAKSEPTASEENGLEESEEDRAQRKAEERVSQLADTAKDARLEATANREWTQFQPTGDKQPATEAQKVTPEAAEALRGKLVSNAQTGMPPRVAHSINALASAVANKRSLNSGVHRDPGLIASVDRLIQLATDDPEGYGPLGTAEVYQAAIDLLHTATNGRYGGPEPTGRDPRVEKGDIGAPEILDSNAVRDIQETYSEGLDPKKPNENGRSPTGTSLFVARRMVALARDIASGDSPTPDALRRTTRWIQEAADDRYGYGVLGSEENYQNAINLLHTATGGAYKGPEGIEQTPQEGSVEAARETTTEKPTTDTEALTPEDVQQQEVEQETATPTPPEPVQTQQPTKFRVEPNKSSLSRFRRNKVGEGGLKPPRIGNKQPATAQEATGGAQETATTPTGNRVEQTQAAGKPEAGKPTTGSTTPKSPGKTEPEKRQTVISEVRDMLGGDGSPSNMLPIHELRKRLAEKFGPEFASHKVLDKLLMAMRFDDEVQLAAISDLSAATQQQLDDSVQGMTETFYSIRPFPAAEGGATPPSESQETASEQQTQQPVGNEPVASGAVSEPTSPRPATKATAKPSTSAVAKAFRDLDTENFNQVSLDKLLAKTGYTPEQLHGVIRDMVKRGLLTTQGPEGRHGLSPSERAAMIPPGDDFMQGVMYVSVPTGKEEEFTRAIKEGKETGPTKGDAVATSGEGVESFDWGSEGLAQPTNKTKTPKTATPKSSPDRDLAVARAAHELATSNANFRMGGIVKVPELYDAMRKQDPNLTQEEFHQYLQDMQKRDLLTLQNVDNPDLEPRSSEMIRSPEGRVLGYVRMRPEMTERASREKPTASKTPTSNTKFGRSPTTKRDQDVSKAAQDIANEPSNKRIGGIVKIPELYDSLQRQYPDMSQEEFHQYLQDMQKRDLLTLQLVNDPRLEPRANEGLKTNRGLLYYVQMRGGAGGSTTPESTKQTETPKRTVRERETVTPKPPRIRKK